MISKIGNWVFGSFFRTIGRLLVFIVLGIIIAHFIDFGSLKDNFSISDLFFDKVDALTYTEDIKLVDNNWLNITNTSDWVDEYPFYKSQITNNNNNIITKTLSFDSTTKQFVKNYDFVSFEFLASQPLAAYIENNERDWECKEWLQTDFGLPQYNGYECKYWTYETNYSDIPYTIDITNLNFAFIVNYADPYVGNWSSCTLENGSIMCPTYNRPIDNIQIKINFRSNSSMNFNISILRGFKLYNHNDVTSAINQQTQQQQQQHQQIMDSNMTETNETASNFFGSFTDSDTGGLSGIITAPLVMINKMLDGVCVQPSATWKGATISLPCGDLLWSRNGASDLKNLVNVFYGGFICYYAIRKLFLMIENLKDPTQDKIEVTDL